MSATLTIIDFAEIMHKTQLPLYFSQLKRHNAVYSIYVQQYSGDKYPATSYVYIQAIECTQLLHSILNYFVLSRLTIVSRVAKKKQAVHDEPVSYLHIAPL